MDVVFRQWLGGAALCALLCIAVVSPRGASTVLAIILLASLAMALHRRELPPLPTAAHVGQWSALAFVAFAMSTALWSATPLASVMKPAYFAVALAALWLIHHIVPRLSARQLDFLAEACLLATAAGMAFVAFEILTAQAVTRHIMTLFPVLHESLERKHVTIVDGFVRRLSDTNLNRRMALLVWLMWPVLLLASLDIVRWRGRIVVATIAVCAAIILLRGSHQSSQLAILGGLLVFAAAHVDRAMTRRALAVLWIIATVFVVPIALLTFHARAHEASWLFRSAQHRVVIWGQAASEVLKSPLVGVGADATRKAMREVVAAEPSRRDELAGFESGYADHAHNVYLQVWYELGAIGAALFLAMGLLALQSTKNLATRVQPYALALFATSALMIASSYSLWQTWFIAACGLGFAGLLLAVAVNRSRAEPSAAAPIA
ncbi:MAG: O-antigen ligase family protein [Hyphomicrobiaceae bacterium]|nr:O-antigen ligase family protein [Hyphomicrobiaceae bacterium]